MKKIISVISITLVLLILISCSTKDTSNEGVNQPPENIQTTDTVVGEKDSIDSVEESIVDDDDTSIIEDTAQNEDAPVAEEIKGITIPVFSVLVNGIEVTNVDIAEYPMYSVVSSSINSVGTERIVTYVGFTVEDLLKAAGLGERYVWLEATASDGYTILLQGDIIYANTTLLAVTKDGSPFTEAPWLAPCSDTFTGNYLKELESILLNVVDEPPVA